MIKFQVIIGLSFIIKKNFSNRFEFNIKFKDKGKQLLTNVDKNKKLWITFCKNLKNFIKNLKNSHLSTKKRLEIYSSLKNLL